MGLLLFRCLFLRRVTPFHESVPKVVCWGHSSSWGGSPGPLLFTSLFLIWVTRTAPLHMSVPEEGHGATSLHEFVTVEGSWGCSSSCVRSYCGSTRSLLFLCLFWMPVDGAVPEEGHRDCSSSSVCFWGWSIGPLLFMCLFLRRVIPLGPVYCPRLGSLGLLFNLIWFNSNDFIFPWLVVLFCMVQNVAWKMYITQADRKIIH